MRKTLKRLLLGLLCVSMLLGCFACKGNEQSGEDSSEQGTGAPTEEQVDRTKPQTGPFSNTTDLSFEKHCDGCENRTSCFGAEYPMTLEAIKKTAVLRSEEHTSELQSR